MEINRITSSWKPASSFGASFCTHLLEKSNPNILSFRPTWKMDAFSFALVLLPLGFDLCVFVAWFQGKAPASGVLFGLGVSGIFFVVAWFTARTANMPRVFDFSNGTYYSVKQSMLGAEEEIREALDAVAALQLLTKEVFSSDNTYDCCELNLIMKDGKRVNVLTHGGFESLKEDALLLSSRMGVPIVEGREG